MDAVSVDLGRVFERGITSIQPDVSSDSRQGQAYVALSRATSREGLQVLNFRKEKVIVSAEVVKWHKKDMSVKPK